MIEAASIMFSEIGDRCCTHFNMAIYETVYASDEAKDKWKKSKKYISLRKST